MISTFIVSHQNSCQRSTAYQRTHVGSGPGGCGCARGLQDLNPELKILILERGTNYNHVLSGNTETDYFPSSDGYSLIQGIGIGGGSNHNGFNYVESPINNQLDLQDELLKVRNFINPKKTTVYTQEEQEQLSAIDDNFKLQEYWSPDFKSRWTSEDLLKYSNNLYVYDGIEIDYY